MLIDTHIDKIRKYLQRFCNLGHARYLFSPRKSIFVEEKFIISSPQQKTASNHVKHKSIEKPSKKNRISTLILSQRVKSTIVTTIEIKIMMELSMEKATTRSEIIVRKKVHFESRTNRR